MTNIVLTDGFMASRHIDRGIDYQRQNMLPEALFEYEQALALTPDDRYAHWNKATTLLSMGDYETGFEEHEWGWKLFNWRGFGPVQDDMSRLVKLPVWEGEDISSKHLLVYHELGFGDAIQTMRYLPELRRRAASVTLIINRELVRLADQFEIDVVDRVPDNLGRFDYRLPFFGVMRALRQTLKNIPNDPYIFPWTNRHHDGDVGICWSGRTQTMFTLDYFLSLFEHDDFMLHSLQLGPTMNDEVHDLHSRDFAETAEVIASMEHVVTIDSAVAHLAGAMGHTSTHLILPYLTDWRWWHSEVWYPKIKVYRQADKGDWMKPFARLNAALGAVDGRQAARSRQG